MKVPIPQPNGWTDPDDKTYPKLPDLAEDLVGGNVYGEAPWHQDPAEVSPATQDQMDEWWAMADRAFHARGKAGSVKQLMDPAYDPVECECGKPYYNDEDYMCPACREALDA